MDPRYRTHDGSNNNLKNAYWGKAGIHLLRDAPVSYADDSGLMAERVKSRTGENVPSPRDISQALCQDSPTRESHTSLSDFFWVWTKFLENELSFIDFSQPIESVDIAVTDNDPVFINGGRIPCARSAYDRATGDGINNPRQQINGQTSFLDGSSIYGVDPVRASALRRFDGTGRMKVTETLFGDLLPHNVPALRNTQASPDVDPAAYFLAGDFRANEHVLVTALHTLFVREHNRLCLELPARYPELAGNDESTYQMARKIVGAIIQTITFNEYLPILLGEGAISRYSGYHEEVNPSISNVFSSVSFRLWHTMVPQELRLGKSRKILQLRESFYNPRMVKYAGVDLLLEGRLYQPMRELNSCMVDGLRNYPVSYAGNQFQLFLDFAALNIQRGRDHGIPDYNTLRESFGLSRLEDFDHLTTDRAALDKLEKLYQSVDNIDPWIGSLAENIMTGSQVGPLNYTVIKNQFERLRDGDRFWFENDPMLKELRGTLARLRLCHVLKRNTKIRNIPDRVFKL